INQLQLSVNYQNNKKVWIRSDIWKNWLKFIDNGFHIQNRKVLLLVDNASSHMLLKQNNINDTKEPEEPEVPKGSKNLNPEESEESKELEKLFQERYWKGPRKGPEEDLEENYKEGSKKVPKEVPKE
ncbi:8000_t:CDS:2, partial [Gigaspora margarita]